MTASIAALIEAKIQWDWSPEQISGWLKLEKDTCISHERIYQHIWADKREGSVLYTHLRQSQHKKNYQMVRKYLTTSDR